MTHAGERIVWFIISGNYERENSNATFRIAHDRKEKLDQMVDEMRLTKKIWVESVVNGNEQGLEAVQDAVYWEGFQDAREELKLLAPVQNTGRRCT